MFLRVKILGAMGIQRGLTDLCFLNIQSGLVILNRNNGVQEVFHIGQDQATILGEFRFYEEAEIARLLTNKEVDAVAEEAQNKKVVRTKKALN